MTTGDGLPRSLPRASGPAWLFIASGPSQNQADIDAIRDHPARASLIVVAINNQVAAAPWADILYSCDGKWWETYAAPGSPSPAVRDALATFHGERFARDPLALRYGAKLLPFERGEGLGRVAVRSGCNSTYQAMGAGFLRGMRLGILTGVDMQHTGGQHHNHADHPAPLGNFARGMPDLCIRHFGHLARDLRREGVRVINATRETALPHFERMPLADALRVAATYAAPNPAAPDATPASSGFS